MAVNFRPTTPEGGKSDVQHPATTREPTITAPGWKVGRKALASPQLPAHLTQSMVGSYRIDKKCKFNSLLSCPGREERTRTLQSLLSHWWQGEESALSPSKPFLFFISMLLTWLVLVPVCVSHRVILSCCT